MWTQELKKEARNAYGDNYEKVILRFRDKKQISSLMFLPVHTLVKVK